jgi:hypothetical protein
MLEISDATGHQNVSTALRDLADRVDALGEGMPMVCVVGDGIGATVYALGGPLPVVLANAAELLNGVVESLPMANKRLS